MSTRVPRRRSAWSRAGSRLRAALRCPCACCGEAADGREHPTVHQATATVERVSRPRRPHAPGSRKSTPEMLSAVRCALSQLQGEPAPPPTEAQTVGCLAAHEDEEQMYKANKGKTKWVNYFAVN